MAFFDPRPGPYRQRVQPVGALDPNPVGQNVGGNPFSAMTIAPGGQYPPAGPGTNDPYQQAWSVISPQLQAAADAINRRSQYGSAAISDLTGVYSQRMAAASGMDVFGPENAPLRGAADWGQSNLVSSGQQQQGSLNRAAAQAGPGLTAGRDLNLKQEGKGAGAAAYGTGISWLDAQVAKASAAAARSALEPSFAAGMGQMQQGILANNLARTLADQQSEIQSHIPELLLNLTQRQQDVTYRNQQAAESKREWEMTRQDQLAASKAASKGRMVGPNAPTLQGRLAYWQSIAENRTKHDPHGYVYEGTYSGIHPVTDAKTKQPIVDPAFAAAQAEGLIPKAVKVGGSVGHYDKSGKFIPDYTAPTAPKTPTYKNLVGPDGKVHTYAIADGKKTDVGLAPPGASATAKLPTAAATTKNVAGWYTGKTGAATKVQRTDPTTGKPMFTKSGQPIYISQPGTTSGQLTYQQAYRELRAEGYGDAKARQYLDVHWKRGERQRPWLNPVERQVLQKAGVPATASYDQGQHAYLNEAQVSALQSAKLMPNGESVQGRYFIRQPLSRAQHQALAAAKVRPTSLFYQGGTFRGYITAKQAAALQKAKQLPPGEMRNGRYYITAGY